MNLYEFFNSKEEYGPEAIAADKQLATHIQEVLVWLKLLDGPADGKFGPISMDALESFQELMKCEERGFLGPDTAQKLVQTSPDELPKPEIKLDGSDLATRIAKYMLDKNYSIFARDGEYNIVYVEGMDTNGTLNGDRPNHFNDCRLVIQIVNGVPKIVGGWEGTTEPGHHYTNKPISAYARQHGTARIAFGQYKAWSVSTHGKSEPHEALVQVAEITVHRDLDKNMIRTGDKLDTGLFAINQHWGYDLPHNDIKSASAGCLVGRTRQGHKEFMAMIKQDRRYKINPAYKFLTAILPGNEIK